MSFCSPKRNITGNIKIRKTCLDTQIINEMVELYNKTNPQNPINIGLSDADKILKLELALKNEIPCNDEYCLAYSPTLRPLEKQIKNYFRPMLPDEWKVNSKTWLNTLDILDSLNQYNEAYHDFHFLTVTPIDFDTRIAGGLSCVDRNLCALNLKGLVERHKTKLGAVFNLDKHNQSGSHWTSLFADLQKGEAYYFDSVANYIPPEVVQLMLRITSQGNELLYKGELKISDINTRLKIPVESGKAQISMTELCNYLLENNNFAIYRFGFMFDNIPKIRFQIISTDKLKELILKRTLDLVDLTKKDGYVGVPDLDRIIHLENEPENFAKEWIASQVSVALSNLVSSIKVLQGTNNNYLVSQTNVDGSNLVFHLDKPISQSDGELVDISVKCFKNYVQHQFKNTECGIYSIHFIDTMLSGQKSFSQVVHEPLNDDLMNSLRYSKYFTPH